MIEREICQRVLQKAVSTGADYAEIFAENTVNHTINMISSKVEAIKDTVIASNDPGREARKAFAQNEICTFHPHAALEVLRQLEGWLS